MRARFGVLAGPLDRFGRVVELEEFDDLSVSHSNYVRLRSLHEFPRFFVLPCTMTEHHKAVPLTDELVHDVVDHLPFFRQLGKIPNNVIPAVTGTSEFHAELHLR